MVHEYGISLARTSPIRAQAYVREEDEVPLLLLHGIVRNTEQLYCIS